MSCLNLVILNDIFLEETESLRAELLRVTDLSGNALVERITLDPRNADIEITDNVCKFLLALLVCWCACVYVHVCVCVCGGGGASLMPFMDF